MSFNHINNKIKLNLTVNRSTTAIENNNSNAENEEETLKNISLCYNRSITNKISNVINKSKTMTGYKCLNKLDKFIKTQKDKNQHQENNSNL